MLAYVFWHWPGHGTTAEVYEQHLMEFHRTLAAARLEGVRHSVACRISGAPWLPTDPPGYEDWYLIDGFGSLETLKAGAISGDCKEPHDRVARLAAGGAGSIYELVSGDAGVTSQRWATWLSKPRGISYDQFYAELNPFTTRQDVSLWQRQLALGPATEFCISSAGRLELPANLAPVTVGRTPIWNGATSRS